ncbi:MAG: NapC/NirT family cytochrome c [Anaerolineales bacterium]
MLRRFGARLQRFFFPPQDATLWVRLRPYLVLGALTIVILLLIPIGWEYTNSPEFCGTSCHTMPPEYTSYLVSPHARIDCVECHIGRGFIATRVTRKAGDIKHIFATMFKTYEFPIRAHDMRPARESCERCHFPEKFSSDTLLEIRRFEPDRNNTPISIYMTLKTGGGSEREGLGRGIHWHILNEVYYLPTDPEEQDIPYVQVVEDDGSVTDYVAIDSEIDPASINPEDLKLMDCITCHNRITHLILHPEDLVDNLMAREQISADIPDIRLKAVEVFSAKYASVEMALIGIESLRDYYRVNYPEFFADSSGLVDQAIEVLQDSYSTSVYPEQKADWNSHPSNVGHKDSPGCFRCHDGKHLDPQAQAIRLECNLCHSIPVEAGPTDFVAEVEISRGPEPDSHRNPNWISLHRDVLEPSCSNCHTTGNPGGVDNSSFCSNSTCHGNVWEYAGFDAPKLRELLQAQLPSVSEATPESPLSGELPLTYDGSIGALFHERCTSCHHEDGLADLNLSTYAGVMTGGTSGAAVVPGDPDSSMIIIKQTSEAPHFAQLTPQEIDLVSSWIVAGAPEN